MTTPSTSREAAPWDLIDHVIASVPHTRAKRTLGVLALTRANGVRAMLFGSTDRGWAISVRRGSRDWTVPVEVQTTDDVEAAVRAVEVAVRAPRTYGEVARDVRASMKVRDVKADDVGAVRRLVAEALRDTPHSPTCAWVIAALIVPTRRLNDLGPIPSGGFCYSEPLRELPVPPVPKMAEGALFREFVKPVSFLPPFYKGPAPKVTP